MGFDVGDCVAVLGENTPFFIVSKSPAKPVFYTLSSEPGGIGIRMEPECNIRSYAESVSRALCGDDDELQLYYDITTLGEIDED